MNYALAKKLKDSGFPQNKSQWILYTIDSPSAEINNKDYFCLRNADLGTLPVSEILAAPTLSELIEFCGDNIEYLRRVKHPKTGKLSYWHVETYHINESWEVGNGKTPEEAVSNLWLKLNEYKGQ